MKTGLVWFRNNLRLDDNPALNAALQENDNVILIYVYDERLFNEKQFGIDRMGGHKIRFLFQSVEDLSANLNTNGLYLHTSYSNPAEYILKIAQEYNVHAIYNQHEIGTEETKDELAVASRYRMLSYESSKLFEEDSLSFELEELHKVFTPFRKRVEKYGEVIPPTDFNRGTAQSIEIPDPVYLHEFANRMIQQHKDAAFTSTGGETMGLARLKDYIWDSQLIKTYKETRNNLIGSSYSSKFSPWLANGCISPRRIYHEISSFESNVKKNQSTYWLKFELLWREFFKWTTELNQHKLFQKKGFLDELTIKKEHNENFESWANGKTHNEFINANMNELNRTGFMSNRGRQIVASFLIHDLHVDWRLGAAYFEKQLMDYDPCSNYGNWTYIAGVGNDPRGGRQFNVEKQVANYDPNNEYINLWLKK